MQCPKCGFEQSRGPECRRCGIIFDKIRFDSDMPQPELPEKASDQTGIGAIGYLKGFYRIFRWISLAMAVIFIGLILHHAPSPEAVSSPFAVQQAESKVREFRSAIRQGRADTLEMDQYELNGWLDENLAIQNAANADESPDPESESDAEYDTVDSVDDASESEAAELEKAKSSIHGLQVELLEDTLRLHAVFDMHGVDLSLQIEGRMGVRNGYLSLEPVSGKLGSMPIPPWALQSAIDRLLESPENREKLRLPPHIRDIKVQNGQLVVSSREVPQPVQ